MNICRDTKADLDLIGPPTPQQVIGAAASNIEKSLVDVNIDVAKFFAPVAAKLLQQGIGEAQTPVQVLAVTMACMSGYTDLPKDKSILGQEEGSVTLGITTPGGRGFPTEGALLTSLRRITDSKIVGAVGKIELFDDPEDDGFEAAFDIKKQFAEEVMTAAQSHGVCFRLGTCVARRMRLLLAKVILATGRYLQCAAEGRADQSVATSSRGIGVCFQGTLPEGWSVGHLHCAVGCRSCVHLLDLS